jgi:predicted permease
LAVPAGVGSASGALASGGAVISAQLARRLFESTPQLGRLITIDGRAYPVSAVMPATFRSVPDADVWLPLVIDPRSHARNHRVVGRLAEGASLAQAEAEVARATTLLKRESPDSLRASERLTLTTLQQSTGSDVVPLVIPLVAVAVFLFVIACASVGGLMFARGYARQRLAVVRAALGATRWRLAREVLTESALVAVAGGALGILLAYGGLRLLVPAIPTLWQWSIGIDGRVLLGALGMTVLATLLGGAMPALLASRADVASSLKEDVRGSSSAGFRHRRALMATQIALTTALLIIAGVFVRSFISRTDGGLGFEPDGVTTALISVPPDFGKEGDARRLFRELLEGVRGVRGSEQVALVNNIPAEIGLNVPMALRASGALLRVRAVDWRYVSSNYFDVMGIDVLAGRGPLPSDDRTAAPVAFVNQRFVESLPPGVGVFDVSLELAFDPQGSRGAELSIAGVVADVAGNHLARAPVTVFVPLDQVPESILQMANTAYAPSLVMRRVGDPSVRIPDIEAALHRVDARLSLGSIRAMSDVVAGSLGELRVMALVTLCVALFALIVSVASIYALVSFSVLRSEQAIGIRMMLGESSVRAFTALVARELLMTGVGIVAGVTVSFALMIVLGSLLLGAFGIENAQASEFVFAAALVSAAALAASVPPALRVARSNPIRALRRA